ncbi:transposase, partial [Marinithermofilum abyssi]|uniref:transposase n=1 Tax=Marinithermofilum abyssi TaxID=1571185 RepID=UPI00166C50BB
APICHGLKQRGIFAVIAHRRFRPNKALFHKWQYKYDEKKDVYICPAGHELSYRTTNRQGFREYKSDPSVCQACPLRSQCTTSKNCVKTVTRHVWEDAKEWVRTNRLSDQGKALYKRRKETIERSFADAKELHGLRYARMRGLAKVTEQCLLTACAQNIKKMALLLSKRSRGPENGPRSPLYTFIFLCFWNKQSPVAFRRRALSLTSKSVNNGFLFLLIGF